MLTMARTTGEGCRRPHAVVQEWQACSTAADSLPPLAWPPSPVADCVLELRGGQPSCAVFTYLARCDDLMRVGDRHSIAVMSSHSEPSQAACVPPDTNRTPGAAPELRGSIPPASAGLAPCSERRSAEPGPRERRRRRGERRLHFRRIGQRVTLCHDDDVCKGWAFTPEAQTAPYSPHGWRRGWNRVWTSEAEASCPTISC